MDNEFNLRCPACVTTAKPLSIAKQGRQHLLCELHLVLLKDQRREDQLLYRDRRRLREGRPFVESVDAKKMIELIKAEYPESSIYQIALMMGKHETYLQKKGKQFRVSLEVADEILTALDMNHVLYTGELPILKDRVLNDPIPPALKAA